MVGNHQPTCVRKQDSRAACPYKQLGTLTVVTGLIQACGTSGKGRQHVGQLMGAHVAGTVRCMAGMQGSRGWGALTKPAAYQPESITHLCRSIVANGIGHGRQAALAHNHELLPGAGAACSHRSRVWWRVHNMTAGCCTCTHMACINTPNSAGQRLMALPPC